MSDLQKEVLHKNLLPKSGAVTKKLPANRDLSSLPWNDFFDCTKTIDIDGDHFNVYLKGRTGPVFYLLHGGGYSGLTWACLAEEMASRIECQIVAPDLRGHGKSITKDEADLSAEQQVKDIYSIFLRLFDDAPATIIIGHSMGGALAVRVCASKMIPNCVGLGVVDVVEGSAMESLSSMVSYLHTRPPSFESEDVAIRWCLQSGTVRNSRSARVSMPSQLQENSNEEGNSKYTWRIDLTKTEPHWVGWFTGLSSLFLSCPQPKILVLAGADRLDKELMIGQMQGKFQATMLPKVGHAIQEDSPDKLADELARFAVRQKIAQPKQGIKFNPPMC